MVKIKKSILKETTLFNVWKQLGFDTFWYHWNFDPELYVAMAIGEKLCF